MPALRLFFFLLLFWVSLTAHSGVTADNFPGTTIWYAHVDLEQMRSSPSGKELYQWLNGEVFIEIHEEIGIDIGTETDRITAFADADRGAVIIVEGPVSKESRDKVLAIVALEAKLNSLSSGAKSYYQFGDENDGASILTCNPHLKPTTSQFTVFATPTAKTYRSTSTSPSGVRAARLSSTRRSRSNRRATASSGRST